MNFYCLTIPDPPDVPSLEIPQFGALSVARQALMDFPDPSYFLMRMQDAAALALAPLRRYLEMIEVIFSLKQCMEAVKDALMPPSPGPLIECIKGLLKTIQRLLAFFPPLSYINTALDVCHIAITTIDEILDIFDLLDARLTQYKAAAAAALALGDIELASIQDCATGEARAITLNMMDTLNFTVPIMQVILTPLSRFIPDSALKDVLLNLDAIPGQFAKAKQDILNASGPPVLGPLLKPIGLLRNTAVLAYNFLAPIIGQAANKSQRELPTYDNF